ncbi:MAG: hypothetical protein EZS28_036136 [Streblomastix strix]|uniref:Uncharacterized protein n=1 Tax=Streblomastix strix TaxID=222440 RepID=A0A5J4UCT5_9EUKA|nr:MAG: hypothetical protein EZS28_036136 [Streblomastix strix]
MSPTEDVLRMGITTHQKISTRSNRPNDPITRIRKDTKLTAVPHFELLRQQARMSGVIISEQVKDFDYADQEKQLLPIQYFDALVEIKAPRLILAMIRENMDAYIDVTQNCMSIFWQMASHTQFHSVD